MAILNNKQQLFCKYYIDNKWNATKAYMKAYSSKNEKTARTNASRLLTNANILREIDQILSDSWLNNHFIDIELLSLIKQSDNPNVKIRAITEYNKLARRYDEWVNNFIITPAETKQWSNYSDMEKTLDEQLAEFYN